MSSCLHTPNYPVGWGNVIDGKRRFGNKLTFRAGPLRESIKRLDSVDFIVNNTGPTEEKEFFIPLFAFFGGDVKTLVMF